MCSDGLYLGTKLNVFNVNNFMAAKFHGSLEVFISRCVCEPVSKY